MSLSTAALPGGKGGACQLSTAVLPGGEAGRYGFCSGRWSVRHGVSGITQQRTGRHTHAATYRKTYAFAYVILLVDKRDKMQGIPYIQRPERNTEHDKKAHDDPFDGR